MREESSEEKLERISVNIMPDNPTDTYNNANEAKCNE